MNQDSDPMKVLYLCEKPSQAKDIANVLGANQRNDGYFEGGNNLVTWCFGHLLEMASPEDYNVAFKKWRIDDLPIIPDQWVWNVRKDAKKQFFIIKSLFSKVNTIVIATDADREGEAIAREFISIRFSEIKTIGVKQGILARLLNVGNLEFASSGSDGVDIIFTNIVNPGATKNHINSRVTCNT